MGIPKLVSMLQPWAERHQLSNTTEAGQNSVFLRQRDREETRVDSRYTVRSLGPTARQAIVDGPALSYHAYGIAVASRSNASHALDALPSYNEVNAIVLDCLSLLESHGFRIVAIFFDGVLPPAKEPTRFERLNSSRKQLEKFRAVTPSLIAEPGKGRRFTPRLPFSFSGVQEKLKTLPALPFLVPAVIDALSESRYRSHTQVVPAEADVHCAKFASLHGGTILTADSDLLVYDYRTETTNIVFFKDIELAGNASVLKSTLNISTFSPTAIAHRLKLNNLLAFSYSVKRDHYKGAAGCITHAKRLEANQELLDKEALSPLECSAYEQFLTFLEEYDLSQITPSPPTTPLERLLATLDPRISEWIHSALPPHLLNSTTVTNEESTVKKIEFAEKVLDMYLPFSIDDPLRATSWNLSILIRQIAYSILRPGNHTTNEWTRRGQRIGEKKVMHLGREEVVDRLQTWMNVLSSLRMGIDEQVMVWRVMGLYSISSDLVEQETPLPRRDVLVKLLKGNCGGKDWTLVHLQAQMEAVLYSWRMLSQYCQVHRVLRGEGTTPSSHLDVTVDRISHILREMPSIACLFDPSLREQKLVEEALELLFGLLGIDELGEGDKELGEGHKEVEGGDGFKAANGKRRRRRRKEELKRKLPPLKAKRVSRAANLFDVLGVER